MRLGAAIQRHRPVPETAGASADDRRILAMVNAAIDDVGIDPGDMQSFAAAAIDQHDIDNARRLAHQSQHVEAMLLVGALAPRQLHGPAQLVGDVIEKALDLAGRRLRLGAQALAQHDALIAVSEPRLADPVGQQRYDDGNEQRREIFLDQRSPRPVRGRSVRHTHSTTSSARTRIASGIVRSSVFAVCKLTASWKRDGSSSGRSAGLAPFRIRSASPAARSAIPASSGP